ncbi:MAG: carbohydrate-binding domain-containing protein [Oscillospiraceae bacterium]|nr:carbohydrate-binding domain-containing protein [Oscillospiraceae bacterium]
MNIRKLTALALGLCLLLSGCGKQKPSDSTPTTGESTPAPVEGATTIGLSDSGITVDGKTASIDSAEAVYTAKDIVYYEAGKDFTYGEGTKADEHTKEEADRHTVVHITKPGVYAVSGKLSAGQIAVDLGEDAKKDPNAVVTLVLNGMDITCTVAPAVIFYNVYECGSTDEDKATMAVDTSTAGANVVIADGTENKVDGAYVARIYKSVELNDAGTEVVDSKKLHKYDGAFYSKMSMNIYGGEKGDGKLDITAANEGLDTELHLTMLGGNIHIRSGNDGINTNEDNISVTAIKGGTLNITVTGQTGEGDGIDSNGWLVIDGGTVIAAACGTSGDAGIDADKGVYIQGGTVVATGNMLDHFEAAQTSVLFTFNGRQAGGQTYALKQGDKTILTATPANGFQYLILSSAELTEGVYQLYQGDLQLAGVASGMREPMGGGMQPPEGMEKPENIQPPAGMTPPEKPQGGDRPQMPEGMVPPQGMTPPPGGFQLPGNIQQPAGEATKDFTFVKGYNAFAINGAV